MDPRFFAVVVQQRPNTRRASERQCCVVVPREIRRGARPTGSSPRRWTGFEGRGRSACLGGAVWENYPARSSARSPVGARGHHDGAAHPARPARRRAPLGGPNRLEKHLDDSAVFFADKLVSMSGDGDARDPDDLFLYCQALAGKHHRRALTVRGEGLVDGGDPRAGRPRGAEERPAVPVAGRAVPGGDARVGRVPRGAGDGDESSESAAADEEEFFKGGDERTKKISSASAALLRAQAHEALENARRRDAGTSPRWRRIRFVTPRWKRSSPTTRSAERSARDRLARVRPGGRVAAVPVHVHGQEVRGAHDRERAGDAGGNRGFHQRRG